MPTISNTVIRQIGFLLIIILLGVTIFFQLKSFLPAFLGAYTLYILLRTTMFKLTVKLKGRRALSAFLLMLGSFLIILVPLNGLLGLLASKVVPAFENTPEIWTTLEKTVQNIENKYNIHVLTQENLKNIGTWVTAEAQKVLRATLSGIGLVAVMYFILFFMLTEGQKIENSFYQWLPLREKSVQYLKKHLNTLVYSNAIGIPLVALVQGIVALLGYWLTGVPDVFLWFVATCVAAVVPILGAALVYVPLSILLVAQGNTTWGIVLFLYGFLVIGSVDNLFRFWLQEKIGDTHPLITIFGVIIGLNLFGFIGLIFGPILISLFLILVQIYVREFGEA